MTDTSVPLPTSLPAQTGDAATSPAVADPSSSGDTNPLDALEAILRQAKSKADSGDDSAGPGGLSKAEAEADDAAAIEAKKLADLEALEIATKAQDAVALEAKMVDLQKVTQSPEYKARIEQNTAHQQVQDVQQQNRDEYEIRQLKHTKI